MIVWNCIYWVLQIAVVSSVFANYDINSKLQRTKRVVSKLQTSPRNGNSTQESYISTAGQVHGSNINKSTNNSQVNKSSHRFGDEEVYDYPAEIFNQTHLREAEWRKSNVPQKGIQPKKEIPDLEEDDVDEREKGSGSSSQKQPKVGLIKKIGVRTLI